METTVRLFAIPATWEKDGYSIVSCTHNFPDVYPYDQGILIGEVTIQLTPPDRRQLAAQEIANLRRQRKFLLDKVNEKILPLDARIQNLLALEA